MLLKYADGLISFSGESAEKPVEDPGFIGAKTK
jgi:hypothetical protein